MITLDTIRQRSAVRPMGNRMQAILAYARLREAGGQPFPTEREIIAFLQVRTTTNDIEASLHGLEARGLIEPVGCTTNRRRTKPATWRVTPAGWAVP